MRPFEIVAHVGAPEELMTEISIAGVGQKEVDQHWEFRWSNIAGAAIISVLFMSVAGGCAPKPATEPVEPILVDSFFSGQALLDENGNGQIDPEDTPVENATFIVTVPGGAEFGDITDETGNAFIIIPSAVEYPVTLRMEAPQDSTLKLIGPSSITYSPATGESTTFLFSSE